MHRPTRRPLGRKTENESLPREIAMRITRGKEMEKGSMTSYYPAFKISAGHYSGTHWALTRFG